MKKAPSSTGLVSLARSLPRRLASLKAGLLLLVLIFAFALVAAFTPAGPLLGLVQGIGQFLALDSIVRVGTLDFKDRFQSPVFILLAGLMGLSLCLSLYFRLRAEFRRLRAEAAWVVAAKAAAEAAPEQGAAFEEAIGRVSQELRQRGYRTELAWPTGAPEIHGIKGGSGVWGSLLFHASILLVYVAVVLSIFASFSASLNLTEEQEFDARVDRYGTQKAGPWYSPPPQPLTFKLLKVDPDYAVKGELTTAAIIEPTEAGKATRFSPKVPLYTGNGLRHAGLTIHQGKETGFAPLIQVWDPQGKTLIEGYMSLATALTPDKKTVFRDLFEVPDRDIRVEVELLPDAVYRDGAYSSVSEALNRPILHAVLLKQGKVVLEQHIIVGESAIANGYLFHFGGVRRWAQIDISSDPAPPLLLAGMLTGSIGLAMRLLWVRRRVVVSLRQENQSVVFDLTGSSEKFPSTFKEDLAVLRTALAQRLAAPAGAAGGSPMTTQ